MARELSLLLSEDVGQVAWAAVDCHYECVWYPPMEGKGDSLGLGMINVLVHLDSVELPPAAMTKCKQLNVYSLSDHTMPS